MSMVGKMRAWGARRDEAEASAEGDPVPGKSGGELDGPEVEDGAAIVGDVASEATRRVVKGERREERVEGDDGGFLERVGGGDEDIHRRQLLQGGGVLVMVMVMVMVMEEVMVMVMEEGVGQEQAQAQPGGVSDALHQAQPVEQGEVGLEGEAELAEEGGGEEEEMGVVVAIEVGISEGRGGGEEGGMEARAGEEDEENGGAK